MKRIRIGQLGMGHPHASGKMSCVRKFPDIFEVVGVAERDDAMYAAQSGNAAYQGVERMAVDELLRAPGLDAVMVESEEWNLVPDANACVDAGVHIHLDKPAGEDIGEYERLMREAKRRKLAVQLAYMYRYNPAIASCIERARSGALGEVYEVNAIMNTQHPKETREWLAHFKGGIMHFLGCHMVDLVLLARGMPEEILPLNVSTGIDGVRAVDQGLAIFRYPNGNSIVESTSNEVNGYGRRQFVICGTKGTLHIEPLEYPTVLYASDPASEPREIYADRRRVETLPDVPHTGADRYDRMMLEFARIVRGEMENPYTYEYELSVQRACLRACGFDVDIHAKARL